MELPGMMAADTKISRSEPTELEPLLGQGRVGSSHLNVAQYMFPSECSPTHQCKAPSPFDTPDVC